CHNPTIFRATEQWFIGMDRVAHGDTTSLRENALAAIKKIKWHPTWGEDRIGNMIATRPDWCISRQRVWGVPIVMFYCGECNAQYCDTKVLSAVVEKFKEHTADYWYDTPVADMIPPGTKCAKCGCAEFRKESDILDVWFDSGSSHLAVLTEKNGLPWPSDMYMEGGDQYRGWFHSSLLIGVGLRGDAPYRECATHGWTLDEKGQAMHKSLGNTIEPEDIIKEFGADLIRLWTASVEFTEDVTLSKTILQRLSEAYRKLRNTFRFALGNLHDFDPAVHAVDPANMLDIDVWILARTEELIARVRQFYAEFAFHRAYRAIYDFATTDLSALYFDVLKDRLYTAATDSVARRSGQTALYRVHYALIRLLAPVLSFTAEETWAFTTMKPADAPASVHCALFPEPAEVTAGISDAQRARLADYDRLIAVREPVLKALEEARQAKTIGAPLEAHVTIAVNSELMPLLTEYAAELPGLFIVSEVSLEDGPLAEPVVRVDRASGVKCARCWKYTKDTGSVAAFPDVCKACGEALLAMGYGK
ncbi:MAG: class I tRNA ligase family protein, partial [Bryobacteraceae bacterium]